MTPKKNTARTLRVGQIEKNPILALGAREKDVEKYARVARAYGNVAPVIVAQSGSAYRMLAGQAKLEACARHGIREIPVAIAEISDEAEQMKLALLLSTVREDGCPLSEGAFIDALITRHGATRRELMGLLKKSKSWLSKRQSLMSRLSESVKGMVKDGLICARTAEEIARMPGDSQAAFADTVVRDGLNKTNVGQLVGLYMREDTDSALRQTILNTPLTALDACPAGTVGRRREKRGMAERIADSARFLIRMTGEIKGLLARADAESIAMASDHLCELHLVVADLDATLYAVAARVSPGKPQAGGDAS